MASRQQEFYGRVYNDARAAGMSDTQARLAASQASLETGYGRSSVGNNYFGIKAGTSWNGPVVNAGTWESVAGQPVNTTANFRSYDSPYQSLNDWSSTLSRNFPQSYWADDFDTAVGGLSQGRFGSYATDPNYGSKLQSIDRSMYGPQLGIMSVIDPPTPTPAPREDLRDVDYANYQPGAVQAAPMQDAPMASFDAGRFGPSATAFDASRFGEPSYFDLSGLLDAPATFDPDRFGTPAAPATTPQQLQRGLLDQQLQAGILPALSLPPSSWPTAQTTPYVDPVVTTAQQPASPQTVAAQPQAPAIAAPAEVRSGLMSPAEYEQVQAQRAYLSTQPFSNAGLLSGTAKGLAGTLGGALLGSLALGPVGGLLGGVIGRQVVTPGGLLNQYPEKPKGRPQGDGSLTDYGRDVASRSDQFSNALNSGSAGLW